MPLALILVPLLAAAVAWVFPQTDGQADAAKFSYPITLAAN